MQQLGGEGVAWGLRVPAWQQGALAPDACPTPALVILGEETEVPSGPAGGLSEAETY